MTASALATKPAAVSFTSSGGGAERRELARRLRAQTAGEVLFDAASRGRYATDASIYQIDADRRLRAEHRRRRRGGDRDRAANSACRCCRAAPAPRSAARPSARRWSSTPASTCASVLAVDAEAQTVEVEPGLVLDHLNAQLRPHGLWFPVDVSTGAQATIGGMAGNNSCGSRSIAYGNMVHNVLGHRRLAGRRQPPSRFGPLAELGAPARRASPRFVHGLAAAAAPRRSTRAGRRCCAASAATTSTSSIRKASGPTPTTAASTSRTCWSAPKARSRSRAA